MEAQIATYITEIGGSGARKEREGIRSFFERPCTGEYIRRKACVCCCASDGYVVFMRRSFGIDQVRKQLKAALLGVRVVGVWCSRNVQ